METDEPVDHAYEDEDEDEDSGILGMKIKQEEDAICITI
jgi:hypothetical protein